MAVLEGQVALITGAGSGMGRSTAELFAQEGARVVVVDIDEAGGEQTVATIRAAGGEGDFYARRRGQGLRRRGDDPFGDRGPTAGSTFSTTTPAWCR